MWEHSFNDGIEVITAKSENNQIHYLPCISYKYFKLAYKRQKKHQSNKKYVYARSSKDKRIFPGSVNLFHQTASDMCATVTGYI